MEGKLNEEENEDYFRYLPDDLLLSIFTRMEDFKFACQCSLVCKRFASLILLMYNITVNFTDGEFEYETQTEYEDVFGKRLCPYGEITPKMNITSLNQTLKLINWLGKFKELTSVHIKFSYGMKTSPSSLLEWKVNFGRELEYVVILLPISMEKKTAEELSQEQADDEDDDIPEGVTDTDLEESLYMAYGCCQETVLWQTILYMLAGSHPKLSRVIITDAEKEGRLCLQDAQLAELKSRFRDKNLDQILQEIKIPFICKIGYVRFLRLPALGYLLKGVTLFVFRTKVTLPPDREDIDDSDLIAWNCDGEELFRDTLREILVNHKGQTFPIGRSYWE